MVMLLLGLPAGAWLVLALQGRALSQRLVDDANSLDARALGLPHNAPGNVIDCLGREADLSPDVSRALPFSGAEVMTVTDGSRPFHSLSPAARAEVASGHAWLRRVVACGALATVAPAGGLGPFADVRHGRRQSMPRLMEALTSLAPLTMREALARGDVNDALEVCAATLSGTTAWLRLEGLEAMLATLGPSRAVMPACDEALDAATPEQRERFTQRLEDVRALAPEYAEVMRLERTQLALRLYGAWLPDAFDARLPPGARAMTAAQRADRWVRGVPATLALRLYWRKFDRGMRDVEAAASLPPAEREAAILKAQDLLAAPLLRRFLASDPMDLRYQMYALYLDSLHEHLRLLSTRAD